MVTYWVPDLPLATFGDHFDIAKWCIICMTQQAFKYVRSSLWPRLMFCELKTPSIFKSNGWGLEKE